MIMASSNPLERIEFAKKNCVPSRCFKAKISQ